MSEPTTGFRCVFLSFLEERRLSAKVSNLSLKGCSVTCDREALCGSEVRVSMLLNNEPAALPVELGTIKWVRGNQFGVEFLRVPVDAQQRLNRVLRLELIDWLEKRHRDSTSRRSA